MKKNPLLIVIPALTLFFSIQAHAGAPLDSSGLLDNILARYQTVASGWSSNIISSASWLFWGLALLSMTWTFAMLALKKSDMQEVLAEAIRYFTMTGFFFYILTNGPAISTSIIDSLRQIAAQSAGVGNALTPSGIVDIGFNIVSEVCDQSSVWSPVDSAVGLVIAGIILVTLALVGVNMLLMLIAGWMLAYGGVFLLGFGGGQWTSDIAINYYRTVLGIALQIFVMILLVGVGQSFIDQYYTALQGNAIQLKGLFVMLVASIVLLMLINKIPPMIASIVGGGHSSGIGHFGAGAAMGAVVGGSAAAAAASAAVLSGASQIAGGASALKAAFQSAQEHMAEGSGMFANNSEGSANSGDISSSESGSSAQSSSGVSSSSGGSSGFSSAMGTAARFGADMAANLAKGATSVAKDKAATMMDTAKNNVAQTMGGKIASEISNPGSTAQARQDQKDLAQAESIKNSMSAQDARDFISEHEAQTSVSPTTQSQSTVEPEQPSFTGDSVGAGSRQSESKSENASTQVKPDNTDGETS